MLVRVVTCRAVKEACRMALLLYSYGLNGRRYGYLFLLILFIVLAASVASVTVMLAFVSELSGKGFILV